MSIASKLNKIKALIAEIEEEMSRENSQTPVSPAIRLYKAIPALPYDKAEEVIRALVQGDLVGKWLNGSTVAVELTYAGVDMESYSEYVKNAGGTDPVKAGKIMVALSKMDLKGYNVRVKPRDGKNYYILQEN